MDRWGSKRVGIGGLDDKRQITSVFVASLTGDFFPVQLVYQGKTDACHPSYKFPPEWDITHTPNHWSNKDTMELYLENIIVPYIANKREELKLDMDFPALMIFDCQVTEAFLKKLEQHNLHHSSSKLYWSVATVRCQRKQSCKIQPQKALSALVLRARKWAIWPGYNH